MFELGKDIWKEFQNMIHSPKSIAPIDEIARLTAIIQVQTEIAEVQLDL